ncbi:2'-5' RNA ligase family protein [Spongisporangium articulatum]|uniref:2'-5' RNA ligase family protein n=1 Tax=Spongisporangium articulatum TaxID=3362603 RepID=A0ABW8AJK8_9ACTN
MTQSVELLLGDEAEAAVRERWRRLAEARLPSMAHHQGETNRPHVTLAVADTLDEATETRLSALTGWLPLTVTLGGLIAFGSARQRVLALLVVPTVGLLELQRAAAELMPAPVQHLTADRWTPHVTLARRVKVEELGAAAQAVGDLPELTTTCPAVRRWDSDARRTWLLADSR